jgi:hypothetical protein
LIDWNWYALKYQSRKNRHHFDNICSDKLTAELAIAAFKCAAAVYRADPKVAGDIDSQPLLTSLTGLHRNPETAGIIFRELEYVYPSLGGSSKAIGFWIAESEVAAVSTNPNFPALAIAVRGTETLVDHMVNANCRPIAAADFLVSPSILHSDNPPIYLFKGLRKHKFVDVFKDELSAHSGFLRSAKTLSSLVLRHISRVNQEGWIKHVIFTGHSAGGGVASLLYLKFLLDMNPLCAFIKAINAVPTHRLIDENLKFSCFTFGAPPILSADITEMINTEKSLQRNRGINLAFVNEFDMVCRVDQSYFRSLIDLVRSVYDLDPVMNDEMARKEEKTETPNSEDIRYILPPLDFQNTNQATAINRSEDRPWPLPNAEYHVFGDLVLLRKEQNRRVEDEERPSKELRALSIRAQDFEKLLYCGVKTHSRTFYGDRMESVLQGKFNYKDGWEH